MRRPYELPNEGVIEKIKELRMKAKKVGNPMKYVKQWVEKDFLNGNVEDTFVVILRTKGCRWAMKSGCTMCGYINESANASDENILYQFETAMKKYEGYKIVKIYTSGSFLDTEEISLPLRYKLIKYLENKNVKKLVLESRPEFVNYENLDNIPSVDMEIEIALGLESANDKILQYAINKGFFLKDYIASCKILKEKNYSIRTYILIKPPFLTEKDALEDAYNSAKIASQYSDIISFNPVCIHKNTLVELLWKNNFYRPPWLWTVLEVLKNCNLNMENKKYISTPVYAPSSERTPHNCKLCDRKVQSAIHKLSFVSSDSKNSEQILCEVEKLDCKCKKIWKNLLEIEKFTFFVYDLESVLNG